MQKVIFKNNEPASSSALLSVHVWREQLLRGLLQTLTALGTVMLIAGSYNAFVEGYPLRILLYLPAYVMVLALVLVKSIPYTLKAGVVLFLLYVLGVIQLFESGLSGDARVFLLTFPCVTTIFIGRREGLFALGLTMVTLIGFGIAFSNAWLTIPLSIQANTGVAAAWVSGSIVFFALGFMIVFSVGYLVPRLAESLAESQALSHSLREQQVDLEQVVAARTHSLQHRTRYLATTTEVAQEVTSELDLQTLLTNIVAVISERFGLYHIGIFLIDGTEEWAELRAASSLVGQKMVARGHRIAVGAPGTIGSVTATGKARIELDVDELAVFHNSPELSASRSILTLPLRLHGNTIGALDMQSQEPNAFEPDDGSTLQGLADLVAVAISNARLFQQLQESAEAERRAYGELSRDAWLQLLASEQSLSVLSDAENVVSAPDVWRPEMSTALQTGQITSNHKDLAQAETLAIPITVSGQVIGVIDGRKQDGELGWTTEDVALFQALAQQLQVALEGGRLYREAQQREARERMLSKVSGRIRESLDMEKMLRTAAEQMRQALDLDDLIVRLADPAERRTELSRTVPDKEADL